MIMLIAGGAALLVALGILGGVLLARSGGDSETPAAPETVVPSPSAPSGTPGPKGTAGPETPTSSGPTPSSTAGQATSTPTTAPPASTPTPAVTTAKFHDIFRAEGGSVSKNTTTSLPFRRVDAGWDNSYRDCPGADCIRGRASAIAAVGPGGTGEHPIASAQVFNTFVANRADAILHMDLVWKGTLASVVGANANASVDIEITVQELSKTTMQPINTLPDMPFSVMSESLGLEAIQGVDVLELEDSRQVAIPMRLNPGGLYRIELKITCDTRVAFSLSATTCGFFGDNYGVEWTRQVIEFDTGICSPTQQGDGCIRNN